MKNFVMLTMHSGKVLSLPPQSIEIVEALPRTQENIAAQAFTGAWVRMPGQQHVQSVILRDKFGFVSKLVGQIRKRVLLNGMVGNRYSVPVDCITAILELETPPDQPELEERTSLYTNIQALQTVNGPDGSKQQTVAEVRLEVLEGADVIGTMCGIERPEFIEEPEQTDLGLDADNDLDDNAGAAGTESGATPATPAPRTRKAKPTAH